MDIDFLQQICESATPQEFLGKLSEIRQSLHQSEGLAGDTSVQSTKDYLDDYHGGLRSGDRSSFASSVNSDTSAGEISLDRLRAAADAADAVGNAAAAEASGSSAGSSRETSSKTQKTCCCGKEECPKAQTSGGELDWENVEFGRQIFSELIETFLKLGTLKAEVEEAKAKTEDQLAEAKERIQTLEDRVERGRYASPPPPSAWPPLSPGGDALDQNAPDIIRPRRTSASHQLPRRPGRPSTGRATSTSVPFGANSASSSSNDIAASALAGASGNTPVLSSDAAFISRSSTPGVSNGADMPNLPSTSDFRVLELEAAVQSRDDTIEHLNGRLESQAQEFQRKIDQQEADILSLQQACEKAQTDADKAEGYWQMYEEACSQREESEKLAKDMSDEKQVLQLNIDRLRGDVETWETRANELEKKERETNGQATALKGLLEKKKDENLDLNKEVKALTQDKDRLTRMVSALQVEDNLSNKLKAQLQEEAAKLSSIQTDLRAEKTRNNELEGELARLRIEFEAKEGELAEAQQMDTSIGGTMGTMTGSDGYASYGKSIASQLALAAAKERAEAAGEGRATSPDDGNRSHDMDTDRSYEEIVTTVVKKRVPRRKSRAASSPLLELFDPVKDDGNESDGSVTTQTASPSRAQPNTSELSAEHDDVDSEVGPDEKRSSSSTDDTISTITTQDGQSGGRRERSSSSISHYGHATSQHAKVTRAWLQSVARLVPAGTASMKEVAQTQQPVLVAASVSFLVGIAIGSYALGHGGDDVYSDAVLLGLHCHHHAILPETASARIWRVIFGSTKIMRRSLTF
ncbi:hypothetical protein V8E36_004603 [Tilletia maclaganii]